MERTIEARNEARVGGQTSRANIGEGIRGAGRRRWQKRTSAVREGPAARVVPIRREDPPRMSPPRPPSCLSWAGGASGQASLRYPPYSPTHSCPTRNTTVGPSGSELSVEESVGAGSKVEASASTYFRRISPAPCQSKKSQFNDGFTAVSRISRD